MDLGYAQPLYVLAFDHRGSMLRRFGWRGPISATQHGRITEAKEVIYDGLLAAVDRGVPASHAGVLVDEEFGGPIFTRARRDGLTLAMCVEKSGQKVFDFARPDWPRSVDDVGPDFVKTLVRYNPDDDSLERLVQRDRLRTLAQFLHATGRRLLLEIVVSPTPAQLDAICGDQGREGEERRTELVVRSIAEFQDSGVEADVWKVEGVRSVAGYQTIADIARAAGRDHVGCVVLGAAAPPPEVKRWLATAAQVPAFIGFAVGRSIWWDEIGDWSSGVSSREDTVGRIAANYAAMVEAFRTPSISTQPPGRMA